jgi:hypothetical protein
VAQITASGLLGDDADRYIGQALDLAKKDVVLDDGADVFRRAGIDDVPGGKLESGREMRDLLGDGPEPRNYGRDGA